MTGSWSSYRGLTLSFKKIRETVRQHRAGTSVNNLIADRPLTPSAWPWILQGAGANLTAGVEWVRKKKILAKHPARGSTKLRRLPKSLPITRVGWTFESWATGVFLPIHPWLFMPYISPGSDFPICILYRAMIPFACVHESINCRAYQGFHFHKFGARTVRLSVFFMPLMRNLLSLLDKEVIAGNVGVEKSPY